MDYIAIGKQIRRYRQFRNLSQEQLAEKINISPTHMSHIETGSTKLSLPVLVKISEALDVSVDNIIFDKKKSFSCDSISSILESCSPEENIILTSLLKSAKKTLDMFNIKSLT